MNLVPMLEVQNSFTLLVAPPAWGKTSRVLSWFEQSGHEVLIFISPLKALALELEERWNNSHLKEQIHVIVPESMNQQKIKQLNQKRSLIVVDEFHLFFLWYSFRPALMQFLVEIYHQKHTFLGLTATWSEDLHSNWVFEFQSSFDHLIKVDVGNFQLLTAPKRIFYYPFKKWVEVHLCRKLQEETGAILVFCKYRQEAKRWEKFFQQQGLNCLSCVGGETLRFVEKLEVQLSKSTSGPLIIVATSALSHGVNLPSFESVYFLYQEPSRELFFQMIARAGRRGEEFEVHSFGKAKSFGQYLTGQLKQPDPPLLIHHHLQYIALSEEKHPVQWPTFPETPSGVFDDKMFFPAKNFP